MANAFNPNADQLPPNFTQARLTLKAKGTQDLDEVRINDTLIGSQATSPADGSLRQLSGSAGTSRIRGDG